MNVFLVAIFFAFTVAHPFQPFLSFVDDINNIQHLFNTQTENMKSFFDEQKNRMGKAFNSSYEEAVKMKDAVNKYFEIHQKKITADVHGYIDKFMEGGRKVTDSWSFIPGDNAGSKMENPDVILSAPGMISRKGFQCETHTIISQGYILNIHRIPHREVGGNSTKTVLLQHGLLGSSADWLINTPEKALAFVLSNAGYDVWLSNVRGNQYSREHTTLKTNSKAYWNFSWHKAAKYDVPAVIDYIIKIKGPGTKISYIGHSMGTTILFAMLALRPEYNKILAAGIALAPVAFFTDFKSPLKSLIPFANNVAHMEMLYGSYEFVPRTSALGKIFHGCEVDNLDFKICKNIAFYTCGQNDKQYDEDILPVFLANLGTGTSWKTVIHYNQLIIAQDKFQQFDYGSNNQRMYGSDTPPEYDLSKVTLPLTLMWANNDLLSSEKDVKLLSDKLPSRPETYRVPDPEFTHLDYLWAIEANDLLNSKILQVLDKVYYKPGTVGLPFPFNLGK